MLQIETISADGGAHHTVIGELDADNCHQLSSALLLPSLDSLVIDLNLGQVTFLDSSALSELLNIKQRIDDAGGSLTMTSVSPQVERVLSITGLLDAFGLAKP